MTRYTCRMDERLKPLIIPGLALVVIAAWFFIVRPMMTTDGPTDEDTPAETGE